MKSSCSVPCTPLSTVTRTAAVSPLNCGSTLTHLTGGDNGVLPGTRTKLLIIIHFPSSIGPLTLLYAGGRSGLATISNSNGGGPSARGADIDGFSEGSCCCALTTDHEKAITKSVAVVKSFFIGKPQPRQTVLRVLSARRFASGNASRARRT